MLWVLTGYFGAVEVEKLAAQFCLLTSKIFRTVVCIWMLFGTLEYIIIQPPQWT